MVVGTNIRDKYDNYILEDPRTWPTGPPPPPEHITIKITGEGPLGPNLDNPYPEPDEIEGKIDPCSKWIPSDKVEKYAGRTGHVSVEYTELLEDMNSSGKNIKG